VLSSGGRGYSFILETEDFTVKVAGEHMATWPGLYCEVRSFSLHTHGGVARGAVEASLAWVRQPCSPISRHPGSAPSARSRR